MVATQLNAILWRRLHSNTLKLHPKHISLLLLVIRKVSGNLNFCVKRICKALSKKSKERGPTVAVNCHLAVEVTTPQESTS